MNYKFVTDQLGSVRMVVNVATGAVAQQMEYDEFGRVLVDTNPGFQPFGFAGGLYDAQTGLVQFGRRAYDPEIGRWLTKDPILFAGRDANLYRYVFTDPVNFIDPTGKSGLSFCVANVVISTVGEQVKLARELDRLEALLEANQELLDSGNMCDLRSAELMAKNQMYMTEMEAVKKKLRQSTVIGNTDKKCIDPMSGRIVEQPEG